MEDASEPATADNDEASAASRDRHGGQGASEAAGASIGRRGEGKAMGPMFGKAILAGQSLPV